MKRQDAPGPRGILYRRAGQQISGHVRRLPAGKLRPFVEHYWAVHWDLRAGARRMAETLPHPSVHWVTDTHGSSIWGVSTCRFSRELKDQGRVFGVKFTPGGFYPFLRSPIASFTDDFLPLDAVFGVRGRAIGKELRALAGVPHSDEQMMDVVDEFLLTQLPDPDLQLDTVAQIIAAIRSRRDITKVEQVARRFEMSLRSLERLFSRYVGVSPRWVLKRYRLHEAVEQIAAGQPANWSRLALDLGYFDQTHFIKDFKALVGKSPAEYVRELHSREAFREGSES